MWLHSLSSACPHRSSLSSSGPSLWAASSPTSGTGSTTPPRLPPSWARPRRFSPSSSSTTSCSMYAPSTATQASLMSPQAQSTAQSHCPGLMVAVVLTVGHPHCQHSLGAGAILIPPGHHQHCAPDPVHPDERPGRHRPQALPHLVQADRQVREGCACPDHHHPPGHRVQVRCCCCCCCCPSCTHHIEPFGGVAMGKAYV